MGKKKRGGGMDITCKCNSPIDEIDRNRTKSQAQEKITDPNFWIF